MSEAGQAYTAGGSTELEPGTPGTFGAEVRGDAARIVWHYRASNEQRTFRVHYELRGASVAYDDVVDVNMQVWGDQWEVGLPRLTSTMSGPGPVLRAWGHPVWVRGDVTLAQGRAELRALGISAGQYVELRSLFPRSAFTSTAGMQVEDGDGLEAIEDEEAADAAAYEQDRARIDGWLEHPWRAALWLVAIAVLPAVGLIALVYLVWGRERSTGYDREYEQEPPTGTEPALVPTLLRQGGEAGSPEFVATLFDLIRRGVYRAEPVVTERSLWGGLRSESVADLEISAGTRDELTPWEEDVTRVVDSVIAGGGERLSRFRDVIEDDRKTMSTRFSAFKDAVGGEIETRSWFRSIGVVPLVAGIVAFGGIGALLIWRAVDGWREVYPAADDVVLIAVGVCLIIAAAITGLALAVGRRAWRRRAPAAQAEAERWEAFRRYLTDFPRLQDAPPASLPLWERYLVYGIAFGIADRVLQGAQIHMPEALAQASTIYWISGSSDLGSGATQMSINDLAAGFGSALAPPNSGSGGVGGGFSGGGGGGFGGGGGGFG